MIINAQNVDSLFSNATDLAKDGAYAEAIDIFNSIITQNYVSPELYYNLGNCHYESGDLAKAILSFERAIKLKPNDSRISKNLEIARSEVESDIIEVEDFILMRLWRMGALLLSPKGWMILQILLTCLFCVATYFWQFGNSETKRFRGFSFGIAAIIFLGISVFFGSRSFADSKSQDMAIIMFQDVIRSGPDARTNEINPVFEGQKIRIIDKIDQWYKVQLLNKEEGWIATESVELI